MDQAEMLTMLSGLYDKLVKDVAAHVAATMAEKQVVSTQSWGRELWRALGDQRHNIKGWHVTVSDDGRYLYVCHVERSGEIHIKQESEGYVVDIWSDDDPPTSVASTAATYTELERE